MEIDTGAAISIISSQSYKSLFPKANLQKPTVKLRTYMVIEIPVLGQLTIDVKYGDYEGALTLYVVALGPCLLGKDWLQYIRLDWANIRAVYLNKGQNKVNNLIQKYPEVFQEGLGTMKSSKAHLHLKEGLTPKFCRPRKVPFTIKESVGKELDLLEEADTIIKEYYSDWAVPLFLYPNRMAP